MSRKIPPMPRECVARHPIALAMNSAAYGILARLLDHFWLTECAPLPTVDHALYVLSRAHKPTWFQNRAEIKLVLQDVIPELIAARVAWQSRRSVLQHLGAKGHSTQRRKAVEKLIDPAQHMKLIHEPKRHERNRSTETLAPAKPVGSGFVDKLR